MWLSAVVFSLFLTELVAEKCTGPFGKDRWCIRGTSLGKAFLFFFSFLHDDQYVFAGGQFVLEPWITPSLFYQFEVVEWCDVCAVVAAMVLGVVVLVVAWLSFKDSTYLHSPIGEAASKYSIGFIFLLPSAWSE